ncbi:MAG: hypothetical protein V1909_05720 [Candidatus Micrarchaeota archaeon]
MEERNALIAVAIIFALILGLFMFKDNITEATTPKPMSQTPEYCESKGATYISFTNFCRDSCEKARDSSLACGEALAMGCDCGPDKCWNGFECEPN